MPAPNQQTLASCLQAGSTGVLVELITMTGVEAPRVPVLTLETADLQFIERSR